MALLAHLLVHDSATDLWEAISTPVDSASRPAFLEQTSGVSYSRKENGLKLISIGNMIINHI